MFYVYPKCFIQIAVTVNVVIVLVKKCLLSRYINVFLMYHAVTNNLMQCLNPVA